MKKLLSLIAIAMLGITTTFAQTAVTVPVSKKSTKKVMTVKTAPVVVKKVETKSATVKATTPVVAKKEVKKVTTATTTTTGVKVKADGTADMRYKANKGTKTVVAGPTKKDGTADMRYKVNKTAQKKNSGITCLSNKKGFPIHFWKPFFYKVMVSPIAGNSNVFCAFLKLSTAVLESISITGKVS